MERSVAAEGALCRRRPVGQAAAPDLVDGVLDELGLPRGDFLTALVTFNVGVELGQLTVIGSAYLFLGWFISKTWYRKFVIFPASLVIAVTGAYWTIERIFL